MFACGKAKQTFGNIRNNVKTLISIKNNHHMFIIHVH